MTVQTIVVQLRRPTASDVGQITEGHYTIDGNTLIMTYADGTPVEGFKHELREGDDARAIAAMMTRKVRRQVMGVSETEEAFARPLEYGNAGIA